jgi:TRAP transporter 4TM/12TM fusion protein
MTVVAITYVAWWGRYADGMFHFPGLTWETVLYRSYYGLDGMFGPIAQISSTYVYMFVLFGAFLVRSGAGEFIIDLARVAAGRFVGGPGQVAVLASGLMGSISGSSVANVVTTGAFTIPLMKRTGFKPHNAGAIEAIASTGGQFMPPIMGAGVFILATLTQTSYLSIALMNVIPAVIFFVFLLAMVDLQAIRAGLQGLPPEETPNTLAVLRRGWHFFVPLIVVIGLLFAGYSPDFGAFWGTVSAAALSWCRRETRMGPDAILKALIGGAQSNTSAGAAIGTLGIIIGGIVLAGLGLKFSAVLVDFSGGSLLACVALVTLISIIIGMGSSTTGSYIILSVVAAPALIKLGVPMIAAHLAVFYAACLSTITPPVCVSAFAAAAIAGADPMRTGFAALKFGATLMIIPFSFAYVPELLLQGTPVAIVHAATAYLLGNLALAMGLQGAEFFGGLIAPWRRGLFFAAAFFLMFPTSLIMDALGLVLLAVAWSGALLLPLLRRTAAALGPGRQP